MPRETEQAFIDRIIAELHLDKAAATGALALDELHPKLYPGEKWWERIDPYSLVMQQACQCIIGQLYGNYIENEHRIALLLAPVPEAGLSFDERATIMETHGFIVTDTFDLLMDRSNLRTPFVSSAMVEKAAFERLTQHWRREILARRSTA